MSAPSMKERKACWNARDDYWRCLDENLEDAVKCKTFKGAFENTCPQQWVKYFNKRREYLKFKARLEAGALDEPLPREKL